MKAVNLQVWCELPRFCDDSDDSSQMTFLVNGQKVWPCDEEFDSYMIAEGDVVTLRASGGVLEGDVRRATHSIKGDDNVEVTTLWLENGCWEGCADDILRGLSGIGRFQVINPDEHLRSHATVIEDSGINEPVSLEVYELAHDLAGFALGEDSGPADPRRKPQTMRRILAVIGRGEFAPLPPQGAASEILNNLEHIALGSFTVDNESLVRLAVLAATVPPERWCWNQPFISSDDDDWPWRQDAAPGWAVSPYWEWEVGLTVSVNPQGTEAEVRAFGKDGADKWWRDIICTITL